MGEERAPVVATAWVTVDERTRVRSGVTGRPRSCREALLLAMELRAFGERLQRWAAIQEWEAEAPVVPESGTAPGLADPGAG